MKKYKLYKKDKIKIFNKTLYRIVALEDFSDVKKGDKGGYIEREENLSHAGDCWVYDNACVYDNARVFFNARVSGDARVYGNAHVSDSASVYDNAQVFGNACVYGKARVYDNARVSGAVWVYGKAHVYGTASVSEDAWIYGNSRISGDARVSGKSPVSIGDHVYDISNVSGAELEQDYKDRKLKKSFNEKEIKILTRYLVKNKDGNIVDFLVKELCPDGEYFKTNDNKWHLVSDFEFLKELMQK